jgi:hypothetical protein
MLVTISPVGFSELRTRIGRTLSGSSLVEGGCSYKFVTRNIHGFSHRDRNTLGLSQNPHILPGVRKTSGGKLQYFKSSRQLFSEIRG